MKKPRKYTEMNRQNYLVLTIVFGLMSLFIFSRMNNYTNIYSFSVVSLVPPCLFIYFLISLMKCTAYLNKHEDTLVDNQDDSLAKTPGITPCDSQQDSENIAISPRKFPITPIIYDKKQNKTFLILTIVSGILSWLVIFFIVSSFPIKSGLFGFIMEIFTVTITIFPIFLFLYVDSFGYLRRLKKNHFIIPERKADYQNDLRFLPRDQVVENRYRRDSIIAPFISLAFYVPILISDAKHIKMWQYCGGEGSLFYVLLLPHLVFPILAVYFLMQSNTKKYIDNVDLSDGRKKRINIWLAFVLILISFLISLVSIEVADTATRIVHFSRYDNLGNSLDSFKRHADMTITSNDLQNGHWNSELFGNNISKVHSPHLYFEPVDGADHYVVYMVDESEDANNYAIWLATEINENELFNGDNLTKHANDPCYRYLGRLFSSSKEEHVISVYVYALKDEPGNDLSSMFPNNSTLYPYGANRLFYEYLSPIKQDGSLGFNNGFPQYHGNVISYGYISGTYTPQ